MTITKKIEQGFGNGVNGLYDALKNLNNVACDATITIASSDPAVVTIQLLDYLGNPVAAANSVKAWVSSTATGIDPSALSGEIALTSSGAGAVLIYLTHYFYELISEVDGTIAVTITDTGTTAQYLTLVMPNGKLVVSTTLGFA